MLYNRMSVSRAHIQTNKQALAHYTEQPTWETQREREREGEIKRERAPCIHLLTGQRVELCNSCTVDAVFSAVLFLLLFDAVIVVTYAVSLFSAFHSLQHTQSHSCGVLSNRIHIPLPMTTRWYNSSTNLRRFFPCVVSSLLLLLFCRTVCVCVCIQHLIEEEFNVGE